MAKINQAAELPTGHIRMKIELTIEGPPEEAGQKLAAILKTLPPEEQAKAVAQIEERLRETKGREG